MSWRPKFNLPLKLRSRNNFFKKNAIGVLGQREFKRRENIRSYDTVVKRAAHSFMQLVKNTFRVPLTRGMKGCYVYFADKNTENFFRRRMEHSGKT